MNGIYVRRGLIVVNRSEDHSIAVSCEIKHTVSGYKNRFIATSSFKSRFFLTFNIIKFKISPKFVIFSLVDGLTLIVEIPDVSSYKSSMIKLRTDIISCPYINRRRRGGLVVSAQDSGSSGPGSSPGRGTAL